MEWFWHGFYSGLGYAASGVFIACMVIVWLLTVMVLVAMWQTYFRKR
jgi:hypothetical protein